jgi:hypothetical protein
MPYAPVTDVILRAMLRFGTTVAATILIAAPPPVVCASVAMEQAPHGCCPQAWTAGSPSCCQLRDSGEQSTEPATRILTRGLAPAIVTETASLPFVPDHGHRWIPVDHPPTHVLHYLLNSVFRL